MFFARKQLANTYAFNPSVLNRTNSLYPKLRSFNSRFDFISNSPLINPNTPPVSSAWRFSDVVVVFSSASQLMVLFWRFTIRESIEPGEGCWLNVELASCCCRLRLAAAVVVDDARCRLWCRRPPLGDDVKVKVKVKVVIGRRRPPRQLFFFGGVAERAKALTSLTTRSLFAHFGISNRTRLFFCVGATPHL